MGGIIAVIASMLDMASRESLPLSVSSCLLDELVVLSICCRMFELERLFTDMLRVVSYNMSNI